MSRSLARVGVVTVALAALLAACGDSGASSTTTVPISIPPTNFKTIPTSPPATEPPASGDPQAGEKTTTITEYTLTAADNARIKVANNFGITVEELDAANATTPGYGAFYPGLKIKIPVGATLPSSPETGTTQLGNPPADGGTPSTGDPATPQNSTPSDGTTPSGDCEPGSYTITASDTTRTKVANKFDITVEQLDAANAATKGYSAFYPGLKIVIPKFNC